MARVLEGQEANDALVQETGVTQEGLHKKLVELGSHIERISGNNPSVMLNLVAQALASIVALIEQNGEPDILGIVTKNLEASVAAIRARNKKESN